MSLTEKIRSVFDDKLFIVTMILVFALLLAFRLSSLYIVCFVRGGDSFGPVSIHILSSVLFLVIYSILYYAFFGKKRQFIIEDKYKFSLRSFLYLFLLLSGLFALSRTAEYFRYSLPEKESVSAVLYSLIGLYTVFLLTYSLIFLKRILLVTKRRDSDRNALIIAVIIAALAGFYYFDLFLVDAVSTSKNIIFILSGFLYLSLAVFSYMLTGTNTWVAELNQKGKGSLLLLAIICLGLSAYGFSVVSDENTLLFKIQEHFIAGMTPFSKILFMMSAAFFLRFSFTVLAALPGGSLLQKKTEELASLQYLNQLAAGSLRKDNISFLDAVNDLSFKTGDAVASWIELYTGKNEVKLASRRNIGPESIETINKNHALTEIFKKFEEPRHFGSIPRTKELHTLFVGFPFEDLILIPLYERDNRIGSLVLLQIREYGFEPGTIKLLKAFGNNLQVVLENHRLLRESVEKERLKNELMLARDMQAKIIPRKMPEFDRYDIAAYFTPAVEVGGDYYDIATLADGRHCILSADVSGKGMTAAFYVAQLKGVMISLAPKSSSPAELLININGVLSRVMERNMFITVTALAFDDCKGQISFARAGHVPVYLRSKGRTRSAVPKGIGIGLVKNPSFEKYLLEETVEFPPGSRCLLVSDGIIELRNPEQEEFGEQRLKEILERDDINTARDLCNKIKLETNKFKRDMPLHDDSTAVAIINRGKR